MTREELVDQINQLPLEERKALLDEVSRAVREGIRPREHKESVVELLRGIGKPDGPLPTDEELKEDYIRYLTEKYS